MPKNAPLPLGGGVLRYSVDVGHKPWDRPWKRREKARAKREWRTGAERYLAERLSDPEYRRAYEQARTPDTRSPAPKWGENP